ncbi:HD-GYP domain-containing protein [Maridesulfovibrio sp.]|uniref:HD-GYP domain-containing protein n=1 Tax=Maridesulfovibrio sp. TaxID=2795000 RepID=UPI002A187B84|nr:HD-GYP domain-containing protein [Maridesulfovibrio sp.]
MIKSIAQIFQGNDKDLFVSSKQVQKQILYRLAGVSLLLAVAVGSLAYLLEMRSVIHDVELLALEQVKSTIRKSQPLIQNPTKENIKQLEANLKEDLQVSDFVLIEVYTSEKEELAEAYIPGIDAIDRRAATHTKNVFRKDEIICRNFELNEKIYIQVFSLLNAPEYGDVGFLEGLYQLPDSKKNQMFSRVYYSVGVIVFAVFGTALILYPIILRLMSKVLNFSAHLTEANVGMLVSMGAAIAKRDCDTDAHNYRVTIMAIMMAEHISLPAAEIRTLIVGSFLHDVGKIAIPDSILLKPGKLNDEEWKVMKTHVAHGVEVVREHVWLAQAEPVVFGHHEKFDGSGYPQGLSGSDIPVGARIFALADVFDALHSKRPYKEPFPFSKCMEIMENGRGSHFDPELLDRFMEVVIRFVDIDGLERTDVLKSIVAKYTEQYFNVELKTR